jgi:hypothetical protein
MAQNALDALGLAYDDESSSESGEEQPQQVSVPTTNAAARPPVALPPVAAAASLPDAGALLSDMPEWDAEHSEDDEPAHDPRGTRYNAVALPSSMSNEAAQFNKPRGGALSKLSRPQDTAALVASALSGVGAEPASSSTQPLAHASDRSGAPPSTAGRPSAKRKSGSGGGVLLPPQLRRPNVTTEELSTMRTAKRPKATAPRQA